MHFLNVRLLRISLKKSVANVLPQPHRHRPSQHRQRHPPHSRACRRAFWLIQSAFAPQSAVSLGGEAKNYPI